MLTIITFVSTLNRTVSQICVSGEPSVLLAGKQHGMIITPNGPLVFSRKKMGNIVALELILRSIVSRIMASQNVHALIPGTCK